jgi:ribosomal protein S18 acetylase RimI-like enzyme
MTYQARLGQSLCEQPTHDGPGVTIRAYRPDDQDALCLLAGSSYRDSRFYYDEHFPREQCSRLYQVWLRKSCESGDTRVLVAEWDGKLAGFITCEVHESARQGSIGLVGVSASARGLGIGNALVSKASEYFAGQSIAVVNVVTQGRNIAAQRLYQRCGYVLESVQLWYHKWYDDL